MEFSSQTENLHEYTSDIKVIVDPDWWDKGFNEDSNYQSDYS